MPVVTAVNFTNETCPTEQEFTSIISDVPLVSVGLMGLGIFTFLTAMRRASLSNSVLFAASFLISGAAIINLSKTLAESKMGIVDGISHRLGAVRDVGLGLSVGLIYLFVWIFVAERPQAEPQVDLPHSQFLVHIRHSASWCHWGIPGEILKWLSLTLCFLTPVLRILWHRLTSARVRGPLTITNATTEIVLSAIFILKLILNTSLVCRVLRWKALRDYIAPIIAMIISASIAIGNLATISSTLVFTDTTAGRLLLSIELYILLLFALINTFYEDIKSLTAASVDREQGTSAIRIQDQINREIIEKDEQHRITSISIGPQRTQSVEWRDLGLFQSIGGRISGQAIAMQTAAAVPEGASLLHSSGLGFSPINTRNGYDWSSVGSKPLPDLPDGVDGSSPVSSFSSGGSSISTVEKILRHQQALEIMLSNLKRLTPLSRETSTAITVEDATSPTQSRKRPSSSISNAVRSPISASVSDFSLSRFPEPPPSTVHPPSPRSLAARRMVRKSKRKAKYFQNVMATTLEDKISRHDLLAVPNDGRDGLESPVWQCDVTSFIDNLTTPGHFTDSMYSGSDSTWRGVNTNEVSAGIVAPDEQRSPMMLPGSMRAPGEHASAAHNLGSTQPGNGKSAKGAGAKVRPRPPPIRVPGA